MFLQIEKVRKKWHCGMPECVFSWISSKDPGKVLQIQRELIEVYENDFSKHNGKVNSGRILMVFRSIVSQCGSDAPGCSTHSLVFRAAAGDA